VVAFFLDENVSVGLAPLLRAAGHAAYTAVGEGRTGLWDASHLHYATERGWTILTHDRDDYRALHEGWVTWSPLRFATPRPHGGILILGKSHLPVTAADYREAIASLLTDRAVVLADRCLDWFPRRGGEWVPWQSP